MSTYLDIFVNFSIEIDEHDKWNDPENNESAPVEVHGVERRSSHFCRFEVKGVVQRFVGYRVTGIVVNNGGFKEPWKQNHSIYRKLYMNKNVVVIFKKNYSLTVRKIFSGKSIDFE